jgi:hypothetical protein
MQNNSFLEKMQLHSDQKLKEIVERKRSDYNAEALLAAEQILRSRNIQFKEAEPDEIVEMTYDEIRDDIAARQRAGESLPGIRKYYKDAGVNIDSKEVRGTSTEPWSFRKVRALFFLIGVVCAAIVSVAKHGMSGGVTIVFIVFGSVALIWMYIDFNK